MFVLKFTDFGFADVRALPKNVRNSLKKELRNKVAQNPEACSEELHGPWKDYRSFHFRGYRVVYRVFHQLKAVAIVGIGTHSRDAKEDIYRRLEILAGSGKIAERLLLSLRGFSSKV